MKRNAPSRREAASRVAGTRFRSPPPSWRVAGLLAWACLAATLRAGESEGKAAETPDGAEEAAGSTRKDDPNAARALQGLRALLDLGAPGLEGMEAGRLILRTDTPHAPPVSAALWGRKVEAGWEAVDSKGVRYRLPESIRLGGARWTVAFTPDPSALASLRLEENAEDEYVYPGLLLQAAMLLRAGEEATAARIGARVLAHERVKKMGRQKFVLGAMLQLGASRLLTAAGEYARNPDPAAYREEVEALVGLFRAHLPKTIAEAKDDLLARLAAMERAKTPAPLPEAVEVSETVRAALRDLATTRHPDALERYAVTTCPLPPMMERQMRGFTTASNPEAGTGADDGADASTAGPVRRLLDAGLDAAPALLALWDDATPTRLIGPPLSPEALRKAAGFSFAKSNGWLLTPLTRGDLARLVLLAQLPAKLADSLLDRPETVREWIAQHRALPPTERLLVFVNDGSRRQSNRALARYLATGGEEAFATALAHVRSVRPWERDEVIRELGASDPSAARRIAETLLRETEGDEEQEYTLRQLRDILADFADDPNLARLKKLFGVDGRTAGTSRFVRFRHDARTRTEPEQTPYLMQTLMR